MTTPLVSGDVRMSIVAGVVAVLGAGLGFAALSAAAQPSHVAARLATIEASVARSEWLARRVAATDLRKRVCRGNPEGILPALSQTLARDAAISKITLVNVVTTPGPARPYALSSAAVSFQASGSYDGVLRLLALLAKEQPQIFLDTVDLKTQSGGVELDLKGQVYCSTSALP